MFLLKLKAHLVGTNKAQAQGGQDLDDRRAAVALDRVVGLQLWHHALPAHMLVHQGTEVTRHKRALSHLLNKFSLFNHLKDLTVVYESLKTERT